MILAALLAAQLAVTSCNEVTVADRKIFIDCGDAIVLGIYTECSYEPPAVTKTVNRILASYVRNALAEFEPESSEYCDETDLMNHSINASCSPPHLRGSLVSIRCGTYWTIGAHPEDESRVFNLLVRDTGICEADLLDLLNAPEQLPALWDLVRNELEEAREACGNPELEEGWIDENLTKAESIAFGPEFMTVTYDHRYFGYCMEDAEIPYVKLQAILRDEFLPRTEVPIGDQGEPALCGGTPAAVLSSSPNE